MNNNKMGYLKFSSLEERASLEVALNLCQESSFKAAALCLESPTYGFIYDKGERPFFVSNPKKLLRKLDKERQFKRESSVFFRVYERINIREEHKNPPFVTDPRILSTWENSKIHYILGDWSEEDSVGRWYYAVEEQCHKLTEILPQSLKVKICAWLYRIALEYISYCRRLEVSFGVSRYFLMNFLTRHDWTDACRLNEKKLAERLLKDARLTILQRYRIACVYCLFDDIPVLWNKLTENEKENIHENSNPIMPKETNNLVQMWSAKMSENQDTGVVLREQELWSDVVRELVVYGNVELLTPFWKKLEVHVRQGMIIDLALMSLKQWTTVDHCCNLSDFSRKILFSNALLIPMENYPISWYNLRSYYSDMMFFFMLEMNENQQFVFFQRAFKIQQMNILECFLRWPLRNFFLETINRMWSIIPMDKYKQCLLTLANLYSANYSITLTLEYTEYYSYYYGLLNEGFHENAIWNILYNRYCKSQSNKEDQHSDYRNLLWKLWEETPQACKQYLFQNLRTNFYIQGFQFDHLSFFIQLLKKSPFQNRDEALFKLIFRDLPQTDRKPMMLSVVGESICSTLLEKENYSLVTWLLQQCFAEDEILFYKSRFIKSENGMKLCFYKLQENRENSLVNLLDWTGYSYVKKTLFKYDLINEMNCVTECLLLLRRGEFTEVERIMNFCLSSDEMKKQFKGSFTQLTSVYHRRFFLSLLLNFKLNLLDQILTWCFDAEESITKFKKEIFTQLGSVFHYRLLHQERWEDLKYLYKWFELSPEEVRKLKKEEAFNAHRIEQGLTYHKDVMKYFVAPLRWCLADEEMVIDLKNHVEEKCLGRMYGDKKEIAKERLSFLVKELLSEMRKGVQDEASKESCALENKQKRSHEEESLSPKKRRK